MTCSTAQVASEVSPYFFFFFSSRRRHTRFDCDWSSDVCSSDLGSLQYVNHATGANVQRATFATFTITGNSATFSGTGTNNGTACTFSVTVQDNGEPDNTDPFQITVTPPGTTEGGTLRSGNIQVQK